MRRMTAWLAVVGVGEDGFAALAPTARALVAGAETLIGGARHLALIPAGRSERLAWRHPLEDSMADITARHGRRVVVLASGDPLWYGIAAMLARHVAPEEMIVLPAPGAFALAAARLHWPLETCTTLSLQGRPLAALRLHLTPGARILALTTDGATPAAAASLLHVDGWGPSVLAVFEHLGGPGERRLDGTAGDWAHARTADLNLLAIACRPGAGARLHSRLAGLPDDAFHCDGPITPREVRAATLAALAPLPGELLWDVGAGSGANAIEWLRADRSLGAVAIECDASRAATIAANAASLGVPALEIVTGEAPGALAGLMPPDAVYLGAGHGDAAIFAVCWQALRRGGRLVANAATRDDAARLAALAERHGGTLTRITIERASSSSAITLTQLALRKATDAPE